MEGQKQKQKLSAHITRQLAKDSKGHKSLVNFYSNLSRDETGAPVKWKMKSQINVNEDNIARGRSSQLLRVSQSRSSSRDSSVDGRERSRHSSADSRSVSPKGTLAQRAGLKGIVSKSLERTKSLSVERKAPGKRHSQSLSPAPGRKKTGSGHLSRKMDKDKEDEMDAPVLEMEGAFTSPQGKRKPGRPPKKRLSSATSPKHEKLEEDGKAPVSLSVANVPVKRKGRPCKTPPVLSPVTPLPVLDGERSREGTPDAPVLYRKTKLNKESKSEAKDGKLNTEPPRRKKPGRPPGYSPKKAALENMIKNKIAKSKIALLSPVRRGKVGRPPGYSPKTGYANVGLKKEENESAEDKSETVNRSLSDKKEKDDPEVVSPPVKKKCGRPLGYSPKLGMIVKKDPPLLVQPKSGKRKVGRPLGYSPKTGYSLPPNAAQGANLNKETSPEAAKPELKEMAVQTEKPKKGKPKTQKAAFIVKKAKSNLISKRPKGTLISKASSEDKVDKRKRRKIANRGIKVVDDENVVKRLPKKGKKVLKVGDEDQSSLVVSDFEMDMEDLNVTTLEIDCSLKELKTEVVTKRKYKAKSKIPEAPATEVKEDFEPEQSSVASIKEKLKKKIISGQNKSMAEKSASDDNLIRKKSDKTRSVLTGRVQKKTNNLQNLSLIVAQKRAKSVIERKLSRLKKKDEKDTSDTEIFKDPFSLSDNESECSEVSTRSTNSRLSAKEGVGRQKQKLSEVVVQKALRSQVTKTRRGTILEQKGKRGRKRKRTLSGEFDLLDESKLRENKRQTFSERMKEFKRKKTLKKLQRQEVARKNKTAKDEDFEDLSSDETQQTKLSGGSVQKNLPRSYSEIKRSLLKQSPFLKKKTRKKRNRTTSSSTNDSKVSGDSMMDAQPQDVYEKSKEIVEQTSENSEVEAFGFELLLDGQEKEENVESQKEVNGQTEVKEIVNSDTLEPVKVTKEQGLGILDKVSTTSPEGLEKTVNATKQDDAEECKLDAKKESVQITSYAKESEGFANEKGEEAINRQGAGIKATVMSRGHVINTQSAGQGAGSKATVMSRGHDSNIFDVSKEWIKEPTNESENTSLLTIVDSELDGEIAKSNISVVCRVETLEEEGLGELNESFEVTATMTESPKKRTSIEETAIIEHSNEGKGVVSSLENNATTSNLFSPQNIVEGRTEKEHVLNEIEFDNSSEPVNEFNDNQKGNEVCQKESKDEVKAHSENGEPKEQSLDTEDKNVEGVAEGSSSEKDNAMIDNEKGDQSSLSDIHSNVETEKDQDSSDEQAVTMQSTDNLKQEKEPSLSTEEPSLSAVKVDSEVLVNENVMEISKGEEIGLQYSTNLGKGTEPGAVFEDGSSKESQGQDFEDKQMEDSLAPEKDSCSHKNASSPMKTDVSIPKMDFSSQLEDDVAESMDVSKSPEKDSSKFNDLFARLEEKGAFKGKNEAGAPPRRKKSNAVSFGKRALTSGKKAINDMLNRLEKAGVITDMKEDKSKIEITNIIKHVGRKKGTDKVPIKRRQQKSNLGKVGRKARGKNVEQISLARDMKTNQLILAKGANLKKRAILNKRTLAGGLAGMLPMTPKRPGKGQNKALGKRRKFGKRKGERRFSPRKKNVQHKPKSRSPVRKFGLRQKISRSPLENIALRQSLEENAYMNPKGIRQVKIKTGRQNSESSEENVTKDLEIEIDSIQDELGTPVQIEAINNIEEMLKECKPCSVLLFDFIKQLQMAQYRSGLSSQSISLDSGHELETEDSEEEFTDADAEDLHEDEVAETQAGQNPEKNKTADNSGEQMEKGEGEIGKEGEMAVKELAEDDKTKVLQDNQPIETEVIDTKLDVVEASVETESTSSIVLNSNDSTVEKEVPGSLAETVSSEVGNVIEQDAVKNDEEVDGIDTEVHLKEKETDSQISEKGDANVLSEQKCKESVDTQSINSLSKDGISNGIPVDEVLKISFDVGSIPEIVSNVVVRKEVTSKTKASVKGPGEGEQQTARKTVPPLKIKLKPGFRKKTYTVEQLIQATRPTRKRIAPSTKPVKALANTSSEDVDNVQEQSSPPASKKPKLSDLKPSDGYEGSFLDFIKTKEELQEKENSFAAERKESLAAKSKQVQDAIHERMYKVDQNGSLTVSASGSSETVLTSTSSVDMSQKTPMEFMPKPSDIENTKHAVISSVGQQHVVQADKTDFQKSSENVIISVVVPRDVREDASARFCCSHCKFSSGNQEIILEHINTTHKNDIQYTCTLCDKEVSKHKEGILKHFEDIHPGKQIMYKCVPDFYDMKQVESNVTIQQDKGNIFERMTDLFDTGSGTLGGDKDSIQNEQSRREKAVLPQKTSAEADSTTVETPEEECQSSTVIDEDKAPQKEGEPASPESSTEMAETVQTWKDSDEQFSGKSSDISQTATTILPEDSTQEVTPAADEESKDSGNEMTLKIVEVRSLKESTPEETLPTTSVSPSHAMSLQSSQPLLTAVNSGMQVVGVVPNFVNSSTVTSVPLVVANRGNLRPIAPKPVVQQPVTQQPVVQHQQMARHPQTTVRNTVKTLPSPRERMGNTYKCEKCNVHAPILAAMVVHLRNTHTDIPRLFQCPYCRDMEGQTEKEVHSHIASKHPTDNPNPPVALSENAKKNLRTLSIPLGESYKTGENSMIEKDIYMCLKCKTHRPSLELIYEHLERQHSEVFVYVCPYCKLYKGKDEETVFNHIRVDHQRSTEDTMLSVAIEDNLFIRIQSLMRDRSGHSRSGKQLGHPETHVQRQSAPRTAKEGPALAEDVIVVGESKHTSGHYGTPINIPKPPSPAEVLTGAKKRKSAIVHSQALSRMNDINKYQRLSGDTSASSNVQRNSPSVLSGSQSPSDVSSQNIGGGPPPLIRAPPPLIRYDQVGMVQTSMQQGHVGSASSVPSSSQSAPVRSVSFPMTDRLQRLNATHGTTAPSILTTVTSTMSTPRPIQSALFDTSDIPVPTPVVRRPVLNIPNVPRPKPGNSTSGMGPLDLSKHLRSDQDMNGTRQFSPSLLQTQEKTDGVEAEDPPPESFQIFNLRPAAPVTQIRTSGSTIMYRPVNPVSSVNMQRGIAQRNMTGFQNPDIQQTQMMNIRSFAARPAPPPYPVQRMQAQRTITMPSAPVRALVSGQLILQQNSGQQVSAAGQQQQQQTISLNQPVFKCPYCPQIIPLTLAEVQPHIEKFHPGSSIVFMNIDK